MIYAKLLLQGLSSTIFTNFIFLSIPLNLPKDSKSITLVGLIFFCVRFFSLFGSFSAQFFHQFFGLKKILIFCELLALLLLTVFSLSYLKNTSLNYVLFIFLCLRSYLTGVALNTRNTLLKTIEDQSVARRVAVKVAVFQHASFFFIGLVILFFHSFSIQILSMCVWFAVFSAGLSAYLLYRVDFAESKNSNHNFLSLSGRGFNLLAKRYIHISLFSVILALAVGGTNTLIFNLGNYFLNDGSGYGLALCLYSFFFYSGAHFLSSVKNSKQKLFYGDICFLSLVMMFVCFFVWIFELNFLVYVLSIGLFFFAYGGVFAYQENLWFVNIDNAHSNQAFALKEILIGLVLALGEWGYSNFNNIEFFVRAIFVAVLILFFNKNYKTLFLSS